MSIKGPWDCCLCSLTSLPTLEQLKTHLEEHLDEKGFQCPHCSWRFDSASHHMRHMRAKHPDKLTPYQCSICPVTLPSVWQMRRHLHVHLDIKFFKCHYCPISYSTRHSLSQHIRAKHAHENDKNDVEETSQCKLCLLSVGNLKRHMAIHRKVARSSQTQPSTPEEWVEAWMNFKPFACDFCTKQFPNQSRLNRHVTTVHEKIRNFKCTFCQKAFGEPGNLARHISYIHYNDKDKSMDSIQSQLDQSSSSVSKQPGSESSCLQIDELESKHSINGTTGSLTKKRRFKSPDVSSNFNTLSKGSLEDCDNVSKNNGTFKCEHCAVSYTNKMMFEKHTKLCAIIIKQQQRRDYEFEIRTDSREDLLPDIELVQHGNCTADKNEMDPGVPEATELPQSDHYSSQSQMDGQEEPEDRQEVKPVSEVTMQRIAEEQPDPAVASDDKKDAPVVDPKQMHPFTCSVCKKAFSQNGDYILHKRIHRI